MSSSSRPEAPNTATSAAATFAPFPPTGVMPPMMPGPLFPMLPLATIAAAAAGSGRASQDASSVGPKRMQVANDYCQYFVDTGERPQNFIRDAGLDERYAEYPRFQHLINLKRALVGERASPPMYLKADLRKMKLRSLGMKFDVIYVDPPWEEYARRSGSKAPRTFMTFDEIAALDVDAVADTPSFLFIWAGSGGADRDGSFNGHLDEARLLMRRWGFRRIEDLTWVKTNKTQKGRAKEGGDGLLVRTKEHCLVGMKGTVKRNIDGDFIHANMDTDVLVEEEPPSGATTKPEEMYEMIEHFCLGRRRLELFGDDHNIRPGWLTIGQGLSASNFDAARYRSFFADRPENRGRHPDGSECPPTRLGSSAEIEDLRPKSPPRGGAAAEKGYGKALPPGAITESGSRRYLTKEAVKRAGKRLAGRSAEEGTSAEEAPPASFAMPPALLAAAAAAVGMGPVMGRGAFEHHPAKRQRQ